MKSLWGERELIWRLAWTNFKVRYKNSILGYLWSLIEPLGMLTVFYLVFTVIMQADIKYYPIFLLGGIVFWNFFANGTSIGMMVYRNHYNLVSKVYIPRDSLVFSANVTSLLVTVCESAVFFLFVFGFGIWPTWSWFAALVYFPCLFAIVYGTSLVLASLNVIFHDIQYIWKFLLQIGFFVTPVLYPVTIFSESSQRILMLNPLAHILTGIRDSLLYDTILPYSLAVSIVSAIAVMAIGYTVYKKIEPTMAERL